MWVKGFTSRKEKKSKSNHSKTLHLGLNEVVQVEMGVCSETLAYRAGRGSTQGRAIGAASLPCPRFPATGLFFFLPLLGGWLLRAIIQYTWGAGPLRAEPQNVHRSCSWLSLLKLLLAEASGFCACRVESSPFRLFRHTGHVSCCRDTRWDRGSRLTPAQDRQHGCIHSLLLLLGSSCLPSGL